MATTEAALRIGIQSGAFAAESEASFSSEVVAAS